MPYFYRMGQYSMQDALRDFLDKSRLKAPMQLMRIETAWEAMMGKTVARYTEKLELVDGILFVTASIAPLKQELLYQKQLIASRVNETLGEFVVREVVIR